MPPLLFDALIMRTGRHSTKATDRPGHLKRGRKGVARVSVNGAWLYIGLYPEWEADRMNRLLRTLSDEVLKHLASLPTAAERRAYLAQAA